MIKKADIVLFVIVVILGLVVSYFSVSSKTPGDLVVVTVDGETYGEYDLNTDQEIEIKAGDYVNNITIKDGSVQMTYSNCKNQVCVNSGSIHTSGKQICCLPHKVLVEVKEKDGGDYDVISG